MTCDTLKKSNIQIGGQEPLLCFIIGKRDELVPTIEVSLRR